MASATAAARSLTPSFSNRCFTCVFTVEGLTNNAAPISGVEKSVGDQPQNLRFALAQT
jgi:hypothetical protein